MAPQKMELRRKVSSGLEGHRKEVPDAEGR